MANTLKLAVLVVPLFAVGMGLAVPAGDSRLEKISGYKSWKRVAQLQVTEPISIGG